MILLLALALVSAAPFDVTDAPPPWAAPVDVDLVLHVPAHELALPEPVLLGSTEVIDLTPHVDAPACSSCHVTTAAAPTEADRSAVAVEVRTRD